MVSTVTETATADVAGPDGTPVPPIPATPSERQTLIERWAERHGVDAARRLAEAEDLAGAVAAEITPDNTVDTYNRTTRR
ncbi:hypothetical protein [Streptomyces sp. SCL15-4]|uniref:hypothetical protein n=1 Tax=Streptomyces sp. SCL15-4 TaxID=2967221 RepID=UPI0029674200|nr:hypothetical protein [Streptomyces sp. SCL15-4]